jgi:bifunctional non-homologous end joining protein LigD
VPGPVATEAQRLPDCLIDGEAVGDMLHVFDLLESDGVDYRQQPYRERMQALTGLIPLEFSAIRSAYTAWTAKDKVTLVEQLRAENKEGVVLKNLTAVYSPGKRPGSDQVKYKFVESATFVVTRVHPIKRSVSLGLYADDAIVDAGNVTVPSNQDVPAAGAVVECRYLYAFASAGAIISWRFAHKSRCFTAAYEQYCICSCERMDTKKADIFGTFWHLNGTWVLPRSSHLPCCSF